MMRRKIQSVRNERGASLVLVAISIAALLSVTALAVDLGMLYKTRGEASRAADAAALAGASVFQERENDDPEIDVMIPARVYESAEGNYMSGGMLDSAEVTYSVDKPKYRVTVVVRREAVGTWFARIFGVNSVPIAASATAEATDAGVSKCVKPFYLPDWWSDANNETVAVNRVVDSEFQQGGGKHKQVENWDYEPNLGDRYRRDDAPPDEGSGDYTGLGSEFRNSSTPTMGPGAGSYYYNDYARPVVLKHVSPQGAPAPGEFQLWCVDGSNCGGKDIREWIQGCSDEEVHIGDEYAGYQDKPGNVIGPVEQGMKALINQDPDLVAVEVADAAHPGFTTVEFYRDVDGTMVPAPDWRNSPRVSIVPLADPANVSLGRSTLVFNNLGLFFLEQLDPTVNNSPIVGRYMGPVPATEEGETKGTLVKLLRLVE